MPSFAQAQVLGTRAQTYTPLTAPTVLTTDQDDGQYTVATPFPINYFGNSYTDITIGVNGVLGFPGGASYSFTNSAPGTGTPNNIVAPFWDDLRLYAANNGSIGHTTLGTAPNRTFVVEWNNISTWGDTGSTMSFQVHFLEGPATNLEVHYGPITGTIGTGSGTMAVEDSTGATVLFLATSACTNNCSTTTDFAGRLNTAVTVGPPPEPQLSGAFTSYDAGGLPGSTVTATVTLTNGGTNTATTVVVDYWLSADGNLDPMDTRVLSSTIATLDFGDTVVSNQLTIPTNATLGAAFLIVDVDATDLYVEIDENDNTVAVPFAIGYELSPANVAVTNTAGINPGETINIDFDLLQGGFPFTNSLEVTFYASLDAVWDMSDQVVWQGSVTPNGMPTETISVSGALPAIVPGLYNIIARVDPNNVVAEVNELNNFSTGNTFQTGPDFTVGLVTVPTSVAPGATLAVSTIIDNLAVPYTGNVPYTLYASLDDVLDPMMDTPIGNFQAAMAGEASLTVMANPTFATSIAPGYYYIIAAIDPMNTIAEVDGSNNSAVAGNTVANAVDFAAAQATSSPSTVEVGDPVNVTGTVSSLGLGFTGNVPFQVHLSPDPTYDPGDVAVYRGFVFFPGGNGSGAVDVTFPLQALQGQQPLAPGAFTVFIVVDPDDTTDEADEMNNAGPASIITIQGADLIVTNMTGPDNAFIGLPYNIEISMENVGVADARNFQYAYYASDNDIIRITDTRIFVSQTATIASGDNATFQDTVDLPVFTSTRTIWIGAIADIFSAVPETSETNNARRIANGIEVVFPIPDLQGEIVDTATAGAAGEDLSVTRIIENIGVAPATQFEYVYYLSSNPTIAADDIEIGRFTTMLATGEDDYGVDTMTLPSTIPEGTYYLGMLIDPDDVVDEIEDVDNNSALGPQIPVFRSALTFITDNLPPATLGVEYDAAVYARGGPLPITWAVADGQLPPGISVDAQSGIVSGTPTAEGVYDFTLRALSGTAFADRAFSIRVTAPTVELTVASPSLPSGIAGRPYRADLIAVGGTIPYTWSSISMLPVGLELGENGVLSGTPETPGNFPVTVSVRDDIGNTDTKMLALNIANANQTIQITQIPLPTAEVGVEFCDPEAVRFEAQNGVEPYSWSVVSGLPEGMRISQEGELCGVPGQVGDFPLVVRVQDSTQLFDTSLFILEVSDGDDLAISTFTLEPGEVGKTYNTDLTAIRGSQPYTWSVVEAWGPTPPGMTLGADGFLNGTPETEGTFAFVVLVTDAAGRTDVQPLTLVVNPAPAAPEEDSGCSCEATEQRSSTPWASAGLVAGLFGLLGFRRRKSLAGLFALALTLAMSTTAFAQQVPGTPYQYSRTPHTFVPLSNPTVLSTNVDDGQFAVNLPFSVLFYNGMESSLSVGANGAIAFPAGTFVSLGNTVPGTTSSPSGFIAPFWDDLRLYPGTNSTIGWQVEGTAPNRTVTVEWRQISFFSYSGIRFDMQVRFYEGASGRIDIDYGSFSGSGSPSCTMGMEDRMNARPVFFDTPAPPCTTNCGIADFPVNTRITVIQDPGVELVASEVVAPELGFLGAVTPVNVTVSNLHGNPIGPFLVEVVASQTQDLMNPTSMGTAQVSLPPFTTQTFVVDTTPPLSLGEGSFYLGLNVDSSGVIPEVNEANNSVASLDTMRLVRGLADLSVERVRTSVSQVTAGNTVEVYSRIRNIGGEPAMNAQIAVMLSTNPVISRQDVQLDTFTVSLAPGETVNATTTVTIDAATNSGAYYIGTYADLMNSVDELSESNNGRADIGTLTVEGGALAITTVALPRATLGVTYTGLLNAAGGSPSDTTWEITAGDLPAGIGLVPNTGELFGRPTMQETQNFTVQVTSGGESATANLTLVVADPAEPLTIVTRQLAAGVVGQEYAFPLVVTGGAETSSLTWSAEGLPDGFMVNETGVLVGSSEMAGSSTITVTVTDGTDTATRQLTLEIRDNANLLIVPKVLSTATFNEPYSEQLEATGGLPPITWLVQVGRLPAGLTLLPSGEISGTPTQVGTFSVVVEARDSSPGALSAKDVNTFVIEVQDADGFSILTESLPEGIVGEGYSATIEAMGGLAPYTWQIAEGRLPEGLIADVDLTAGTYEIVGQPSEDGVYSLLIEVTDSQGRLAVRALSITVSVFVPPPVEEDDGGCGCDTSGSDRSGGALAGILLLAGLGLARRRRR